MSLKSAYQLAEVAGCNLYFAETEEDPPVAIFTTKNQSRELGQNSLKPKFEPKPSAQKLAHDSKRLDDLDRTEQSDKKIPADRPKFTVVPDDPD